MGRALRLSARLVIACVAAAVGVGLFAGDASAGPGDPAPITDYASYPDAIVPAIYPEGCDARQGGLPHGETYRATDAAGTRTSSTLTGLGYLAPGTVVTMSWNALADGCEQAGISIAVKRADSPTFDAETNQEIIESAYDYCGPAGESCASKSNTLTITMPPLSVACAYQVDSVVGPPLAVVGPDGSYYGERLRLAHDLPGGEDTLIHANNGGAGECGEPEPSAAASFDCSTPGATLTLGNTGDLDATFAIIVTGGPGSETFDIAGGTTGVTRDIAIPEGETRTIEVTAEGETVYGPTTWTRDCEAPGATLSHECGSDVALVSLTNAGPNAATVEVLFNAGGTATTVETVTIPGATGDVPGEAEVAFPIEEDGVYLVTVTDVVAGETLLLLEEEWTQGCIDVRGVTFEHECTNTDGAVVTISNTGETDTTVTVLKGDEVVVTGVAVPGSGEPVAVTVPLTEDETATVTVQDAQGAEVASSEIERDCYDSSATIAAECVNDTEGQVTVTVTNGGELPATYAVLAGASEVASLEVAAGATGSTVVAVEPGLRSTYAVEGPDGQIASDEVVAACVEPSSTPRAPEALPRTGADHTDLLLVVAGLLLLLGGASVAAGQRRLAAH